jgi:exodeoxyribonuclease VII large subunit
MQNQITQKIYTVSELNADIKALLEAQYPFVWIHAEISNFRQPISGHFYFTLKDESAQINAVMFRGQQRQLKFMPENGMTVTGMGRLSVYEPRGTYQIILEYLEPSGIGALQIAFEKLKQRLADEGFFDESHKKALPFMPQSISILTSSSGAVVHDILKIIYQRFPDVCIEIIPVKVQGEGSSEEIVAGLHLLNQRGAAEVAILARGGGSIEDLQAFNSEKVARAIFYSKIPVISAIGHETDYTIADFVADMRAPTPSDYTIADFVADMRAPTPSAAAEIVVPEKAELQRRCTELRAFLKSSFRNYINRLKLELKVISEQLIDPRKTLQDLQLRVDDLSTRLHRLIFADLHTKQQHFNWWMDRFTVNNPMIQLLKLNEKLDNYACNILKSFKIYTDLKKSKLRELSAKLQALSPHAILQRGYSITRTIPDADVVRDCETVALNQEVEVLLAKGHLFCRVKGKSANGSENVRTIDETA